MAILYRTAKFKSTNILVIAIWGSLPNLIPANISGYTVHHSMAQMCIQSEVDIMKLTCPVAIYFSVVMR